MKICYLSNNAFPSPVASSIQTVKMCEAFSKLNNQVTLISTNESISKKNFSSFYNIKSIIYMTPRWLLSRVSFWPFPSG